MYFSTTTRHLLCLLLLVLASGCQQQAQSTDTPTETEAAAKTPSDTPPDDAHAVKTVAAEQPIQAAAKTVEPVFLSAPLESEVEADEDSSVRIIRKSAE